ncbi:MAG TPA: fibronectin type III domain-containing protein [Ruminiclostridium sp.]|nr:fibronectin type III domain-containing protein [Ruminiclostridium sp.]
MLKKWVYKIMALVLATVVLANVNVGFAKTVDGSRFTLGNQVQAASNSVFTTPIVIDTKNKSLLAFSNGVWNTVYTDDLFAEVGHRDISYDGKLYFTSFGNDTFSLYYFDFNLKTIKKCSGTEGLTQMTASPDGRIYWSENFTYDQDTRYYYSKVFAYNPVTDTNTLVMQTPVYYSGTSSHLLSREISSMSMSLDQKLLFTYDCYNVNVSENALLACYDVKNKKFLFQDYCGYAHEAPVILSDNSAVISIEEEYEEIKIDLNKLNSDNSYPQLDRVYLGGAWNFLGANQTMLCTDFDRHYMYKCTFKYGTNEFTRESLPVYDENGRELGYDIMSNGEVFTITQPGQAGVKYPPIVPQSPSMTINSPAQNDVISDMNSFIPSITVSDPYANTLTCKYYIDSVVKDTKTVSNTATAQKVNFNTLDINSLSDGNHTIKFEVSDGASEPVTQSVSVTVDKTPPVMGNVSFSSDDTSVTISGSATDGAADATSLQYRYTVGSSVTDWSSSTSKTITFLTPDTEYNARFEVKDRVGHVAAKEQKIRTKAQIPQIAASNSRKDSMDIVLSDLNPSTVKYQIMADSSYVSSSGDLTTSPQWLSLVNKKITVKGLTPNKAYKVKAKAKSTEGLETLFSTVSTGTTLSLPPDNIRFEAGINNMKITWDAVTGATGYDIEADGKVVSTGTVNSYTYGGLQAETTHTYRVRVKNAGGTGEWSNSASAVTLPNPPEAPEISDTKATQTEISISWDAVAKADSYEIEADGKTIDTGTNTAYTDKNLTPDTTHKYRVRAQNAGGSSDWSTVTEVKTLPNPPEIPKNLKADPTRTTMTLTWDTADRAEGYCLEIDGVACDMGKANTYTQKDLTANTAHTYRISAYNVGGASGWSEPVKIKTWPEIPATPANIIGTAENTSVTLTWYSVNYAESYDVQIDGKTIENVKDTTYTDTGLLPGTKHSYKVRAKNISGSGQWSNAMEISTLPKDTGTGTDAQELANIAAVVTNKSVTISWQSVKADSRYEIEVDGEIKDNGDDTVYSHTGLEPQTFHTYRVRTKDANGNGQWCAVLAISTLPNPPDAPANISAAATDTQIELKWDKAEGASYDVEVDGNVVDAGDATDYTDQGLTPGTSHTYRVRGKNMTGVTAWSDSITKSTTSPSYEVQCSKDKEFDFLLLAANVQDFSHMTFTVTYNPDELEVTDLCQFTAAKETVSGKIPGTNLTANCTAPGKIEFTVDESVNPGNAWSGEISTIVFKPKITGKAVIDFNVK